MKISLLAASALLAGIASTQSLAGLPACAYSCVEAGYPPSCKLDAKCICSSTQFINAVTCCVSKACDLADQEATLKFANGICNPEGVTNLPKSASCAAATGNSTGSASSTGAVTATTSVSSAAASSQTTATAGTSVSATESSAQAAATSNAATFLKQGAGVAGVFMIGAAALL